MPAMNNEPEDFEDAGDEPEGTLPREWAGMLIYSSLLYGALRAAAEMLGEIAPDRIEEAHGRAVRTGLRATSLGFENGSVVGDDETPACYIKGGNAAIGMIDLLFADLRR